MESVGLKNTGEISATNGIPHWAVIVNCLELGCITNSSYLDSSTSRVALAKLVCARSLGYALRPHFQMQLFSGLTELSCVPTSVPEQQADVSTWQAPQTEKTTNQPRVSTKLFNRVQTGRALGVGLRWRGAAIHRGFCADLPRVREDDPAAGECSTEQLPSTSSSVLS